MSVFVSIRSTYELLVQLGFYIHRRVAEDAEMFIFYFYLAPNWVSAALLFESFD